MKKILLFLFAINCFGQAPTIQWQKTFGGLDNDQGSSIQPTSDGGYIIAGKTTSSNNGDAGLNHGANDFLLLKISSTGTIEWQKILGGSGDDIILSVLQTMDGGYITAGYSTSNDYDITGNHGNGDLWVVKFNDSGIVEWQKTFGGTGFDYANRILQTNDGSYIIGGTTHSYDGDISGNHGSGDMWILKLTQSGLMDWQKTFGGSSHEFLQNMNKTSDGGYILAGMTSSNDGDITENHGMHDYWIVKITASGNLQWETAMGGSDTDVALDAKELTDGNYITTGYTYSSDDQVIGNRGSDDLWVVKLNSTGTMLWAKTFGGSSNDLGTTIIPLNDNGFIISGGTRSSNGDVIGHHSNYWDSLDGWVIKLNDQGNLQWQKTLGGSEDDNFSTMCQNSDGSFILVGYTVSNNGDITQNYGSADYWAVKLGPETLSNPDFKNTFFNVYPNPTTNLLNIQFSNQFEIDKLVITDLAGKILLKQIGNTPQINTENLAKGIYLLEVFSSDEKKYLTKFIKQ